MKKLICQVIDGYRPQFRVIATNDRETPLEIEIGVFSQKELIQAIANLTKALAETNQP